MTATIISSATKEIRIGFDHIHDLLNLIDLGSVWLWPMAPLVPVNWTEFTLVVSPLVPNRNSIFFQIGDIGFPFEEPE